MHYSIVWNTNHWFSCLSSPASRTIAATISRMPAKSIPPSGTPSQKTLSTVEATGSIAAKMLPLAAPIRRTPSR